MNSIYDLINFVRVFGFSVIIIAIIVYLILELNQLRKEISFKNKKAEG